MSQLNTTKNRIKSIDSTRKITKAMELVASVKLKRWQRVLENSLNYTKTLENIVTSCFGEINQEDPNIPLAFKYFPKANKKLMIVVSSSLGLCGGYNYNVFKFVDSIYNDGDRLISVGLKASVKYNEEEYDSDTSNMDMLERLDFAKVKKLVNLIEKEYATGEYKSVVLIYTAYRNSLRFEPTTFPLYPVSLRSEERILGYDPIYEPNRQEFTSLVLPKYIETVLYSKLIESMVSEQASRRNAMDSATDNADELVEKLTLQYNKARQASITDELIDVVAGARANG